VTNYERGRMFEYELAAKFENLGWFVFRSAGSHTPVDLLVCLPNQLWFIQCKTTTKTVSLKKMLSDDNVKMLEQMRSEPWKRKFIFVREGINHNVYRSAYEYRNGSWVRLTDTSYAKLMMGEIE
jgi:Holliday junction resolvase